MAAIPVVVAGSVVAGFAIVRWYYGPQAGDRLGTLTWKLEDVSANARTLQISHEDPGCTSRPGRLVVRETIRTVFIEVPDVSTGGPGPFDTVSCNLALNFTTSRVRLAAPLGRRTLHQPRRSALRQVPSPVRVGLRYCRKAQAFPDDAPARDVPFVVRRLRICTEPLPGGLRRMAFLRRPASPDDRLRRGDRDEPESNPFVTRPGALRGTRTPARLWLLPGPRVSCLYVAFYLNDTYPECLPSGRVARDGIHIINEYDGCERPGFRVRMAGIVPAGVRALRLTRDGRTVARPRVMGGAWAAKARHPDLIEYGDRQVRPEPGC